MEPEELYGLAKKVFREFRARALRYEEDAIQDAVLRAWQVRDRYDPTRSAEVTFFSTVMRNEIREHLKLRRNRPTPARSLSEAYEDSGNPVIDPSEDARRRILAGRVTTTRAPVNHAEILRLHGEDLHNAEIARRVGVPESTVLRTMRKHGLQSHSPAARARYAPVREAIERGMAPEAAAAHFRVPLQFVLRAMSNAR